MANMFYNMLVFSLSLEVFAYLAWASNLFGGFVQYPFGSAAQLNNMNNLFSIDAYSAIIGTVGILTGVGALLLRNGTYAIYALIIFVFGIFFNIVKGLVTAIPNSVAAIFVLAGVDASTFNPILAAIGALVTFAGFIFLAEMALQRKIS